MKNTAITILSLLVAGTALSGCNTTESAFYKALPEADSLVINNPDAAADTLAKAVEGEGVEDEANGEKPKGCQEMTAHITRETNDVVRRTLDKLEHITSHPATEVDGNVSIYMPPEGEKGHQPQGENGQPPQGENGQAPQGEDGQPPQGENGQPPQGDADGAPEAGSGQPPQGESGQPPKGDSGKPPQGEELAHRLIVTEYEDGSFTYQFQVAALDSDDFVDHIVGQLDAGSEKKAGSGYFTIDFGAMSQLDPDRERSGLAAYSYDFTEEGVRAIQVDLSDMSTKEGDILNGALDFEGFVDGSGTLDSTRFVELSDDLVPEDFLNRAQWNAEKAGRCDSLATGGQFEDEVAELVQCWDENAKEVYFSKVVDGSVKDERGESSACAMDAAPLP